MSGPTTRSPNLLPRVVAVESNRLDPVTWTSGPATAGKTNDVDATAGAKTVPLPTGVAAGIPIAVQKTDASANGISITGTIRGVASSTLPIEGHRYETQMLVSEGSDSWRPVTDHKTWASIRQEILATRLDQLTAPTGAVALNAQKITGLADPTSAQDAVTKAYGEASILGKPLALTGATAATRYVGATASGAPSTGTFLKGDFVVDQTGQTFVCTVAGTPGTWVGAISGANTALSNLSDAGTARWNARVMQLDRVHTVATSNVALSGLQTIDSYTLVAGDRVLLTAQTTGSQNGPWVAASGSWTRPTDYPTGVAMPARTVTSIGGKAAPETWVTTTTTTLVVDSIASTWQRVGFGGFRLSEARSPSAALQTSHEFFLSSRSSPSLSYAAAFVRSTAANKPTAFDVLPNGSGYVAGNGFAWIDVCDEDVDTTSTCATARIGIDTDHAFVGGVSYKGGSVVNTKPFYVRVPTDANGTTTPAIRLLQAISGVAAGDSPSLVVDPAVVLAQHGGSVVAGSGYQLATTASIGFLYVPQMAGAPTGAPALQTAGYPDGWSSTYPFSQVGTGKVVPIVIDVTNSKLWARIGGTWKGVVLA